MAAQEKIARLGAIGDVHCEHARLAAVLAFLRGQSLDLIVCVGDIADGAGDIEETCELLQGEKIVAVAGNHDRWLLANQMRELSGALVLASVSASSRAYLASLPLTLELTTCRGLLLLCHGLGPSDMSCVKPSDYGYALESNTELQQLVSAGHYRFVVNGHTHERMLRRFGDLVIINAGTLKRDDAPCCVVIDFDDSVVQFFDLDESGNVVPDGTTLRLSDRSAGAGRPTR